MDADVNWPMYGELKPQTAAIWLCFELGCSDGFNTQNRASEELPFLFSDGIRAKLSTQDSKVARIYRTVTFQDPASC